MLNFIDFEVFRENWLCVIANTDTQDFTKHGLDGNKLYHVLNSMKHRCDSPKSKSYHRYGGRGITVCDTWRNDPYSFIGWAMTHGYEDGLSIDRIDNDGNNLKPPALS